MKTERLAKIKELIEKLTSIEECLKFGDMAVSGSKDNYVAGTWANMRAALAINRKEEIEYELKQLGLEV